MLKIEQLTSPKGYVSNLLGDGWAHYYRFVHPAYDLHQGAPVDLSWADLARRRGVDTPDLGTADWYDVSGSRLHHPREDRVFGGEPAAGPTLAVLAAVLNTLNTHRQLGSIMVAEWTGYDESLAGRNLNGATFEGVRTLAGSDYSVWRADLTLVLELIAGDEAVRPAHQAVLANYLWSASGDWLVAADLDLASTYCATTFAVDAWEPPLEWCPVDADTRLH